MLELAHPDTGHRLAVLSLSHIEMRAAVRRRARLGDLHGSAADDLIAQFEGHLAALFLVQPVNDAVLQHAAEAVDRHMLRAYDAIQLGGCLALQATLGTSEQVWLVTADRELIAAGTRDGLHVVDPAE